jgi:DNA-binding GntR family transcriptional regulator
MIDMLRDEIDGAGAIGDLRVNASDRAFHNVWAAISRGGIAPGSLVTEQILADSMAISRTPMRDAVQRLEALGLLVREPARGLRVPPMTIEEMEDLSATREVLEGLLAASAAQRVAERKANPAPLRAAHERQKRILATGDAELALEAGLGFHETLRRMANNRSAMAYHQQVLLAFERYRHLATERAERPEQIASEHAAVIAAIEAGDPVTAEVAMRRHIAAGRALYRSVLKGALEQR